MNVLCAIVPVCVCVFCVLYCVFIFDKFSNLMVAGEFCVLYYVTRHITGVII